MKFVILILIILSSGLVLGAIDFNEELTNAERQQFDEILAPVMKIYNFIKYAATVIGVLMMMFSGITFIMANGEQAKKEKAKHMATGVIVGLIVIWIAPLVVQYIFN